MPVLVVPLDATMQLRLITGTNPGTGKPIIHTKSFSRVKESVNEQDVLDVAEQLVSLQKYTLEETRLNKSFQLTS